MPAPADTAWEWENPRPQGQTLRAAWAFSSDDLWAVGDYGALVHWNGKAWLASRVPTYESIRSIWGTASTDVWAGGTNGILLHCDGHAWSKAASGTSFEVFQLWGSAADDVWALGRNTTANDPTQTVLIRWDGHAWSAGPSPSQVSQLGALWGTSRNDIWVGSCAVPAGDQFASLLFHWDGTGWTPTTTTVDGCVTELAGTRRDDVWASLRHAKSCDDGYGHRAPCPMFDLAHWDGKAWTHADGPVPGNDGARLSAGVSHEVFAQAMTQALTIGLFRWTGGKWSLVTTVDPETNLSWLDSGTRVVAGTSPRDVWLFGTIGEMQHWDGQTLNGFTEMTPAFSSMWASSEHDLWAVGARTVFHRSSGAWSATDVSELVSSSDQGLSLIWGSAPDDVWAVGFGVALHWDGATWKKMPVPFQIYQRSLWGSGSRDVYVGGEEGLFHFDGKSWTHVLGDVNEEVYAVWGSAANDVWVATNYWHYSEGAYANLYHFDGKTWTQAAHLWQNGENGRIISLSGTGPNDVWAMGEVRVLHWDGVSWTTKDAGLPDWYGSWHVWARTPDDVWAPASGKIHSAMHFDGQSWSQIPTPAGSWFFSLPGGSLWSYGEGALLRHR